MSKRTDILLAVAAGAAVGAALGVLYAPEKGRETRDKLSFKLEKYRDMLLDLIQELMVDKENMPSAAKSEGQKVIRDAKDKAERLLVDVDSLINQINSKKEA